MALTTWNPSDKDAAITLSNANLTAAQSSVTNGFRSVRSTISQATGKVFFEITQDLVDASNGVIVGAMLGSALLTTYPGGNTNGVGWQMHSGLMYYNSGASLNTGDIVAQGATGILALNFTNDVWYTYAPAAARWNGNVANGPITGVGGVSMHALTPLFAAFSGFDGGSPDQVTANFGASAFINTAVCAALVTAGYSPWGSAAPTGANARMFLGML